LSHWLWTNGPKQQLLREPQRQLCWPLLTFSSLRSHVSAVSAGTGPVALCLKNTHRPRWGTLRLGSSGGPGSV
jgi:hypothetical protein